jgi:hypothetical protein
MSASQTIGAKVVAAMNFAPLGAHGAPFLPPAARPRGVCVAVMIETITRSLAALGKPGSLATRRTCAPGDLHLQVAGVGPVALVVPYMTAR